MEQQQQQFKELVGKFGDVFALSNMELEGTVIFEYEIHVKQDTDRRVSSLTTTRKKHGRKLKDRSRNCYLLSL